MHYKSKINIGMIGMGYISDVHLKAFLSREDVVIKAISDNNQSRLLRKAKELGIEETYPDYRYMLEDKDIDVIDIMTPHFLHTQHVCDALEAGKTVICEKPITTNTSELNKIIRTIKKTKRNVYIKQYLRHSLAWKKFQEKLEESIVGELYLAQCLFTGHGNNEFNDPHTWKADKIAGGGGVFVDIAVHMLDRLTPILGAPKLVYGQKKQVSTQLKEKGEDVAVAVFEFPKNVLANFTMTQCDPGFGFRWEVKLFGSKGVIEIADTGKEVKTVRVIKHNKEVFKFEEANWWEDSNVRAIHSILDRIQENVEPAIAMDSAKSVIHSLEQFYKLSEKKA